MNTWLTYSKWKVNRVFYFLYYISKSQWFMECHYRAHQAEREATMFSPRPEKRDSDKASRYNMLSLNGLFRLVINMSL